MRWTRRGAGVTACALSFLDYEQTVNNVGHYGIREANPLLASHHGTRVRGGLLLGLKSFTCAAPLLGGEYLARHGGTDSQLRIVTIVPLAEIGIFSWVTIHNAGVISRRKALSH